MNNFYGYPQYGMYPPQVPQSGMMNNNSNNMQISYTNGLTGAKGYSVPPNTTIFLMDSDAPKFYVKTSDRNGMCTIKAYRFEEVVEPEEAAVKGFDASKYVTKDELQTIITTLTETMKPQKATQEAPVSKSLL